VRGCRILGSIIPSGHFRVDKSKWYGRAFLQPDKDSEDFDPSLDGILFSRPYEWRLNLESGSMNEGYITSEKIAMDFPVINDKFIGIRNKYGYAQVADSLATSKTSNILTLVIFEKLSSSQLLFFAILLHNPCSWHVFMLI
jgi:carotenoid cleavage dioxygenase